MPYIMEQYDDALKKILKEGVRKENRTGIATRAIFDISCRYKINDNFPLLTGRKVWPKSIFAELLWFISGSTLNRDLVAMGSNIWTPWVDKDWAKSKGFLEDALGALYGFQLRYFDGYYGNGDTNDPNYGSGGFDQLKYIIDKLKNEPNDRRILFSLWNPKQLKDMRLAPCHYTFQLFVSENKLSGKLVQRSCDFPIGIPANNFFYSAFIYMLAQQTGFEPYEFIHSAGDAHIYENQIPAVEEYLSREKPDSPKLKLNKAKDIFSYKLDDFEIIDYKPLSPIKIPVAV